MRSEDRSLLPAGTFWITDAGAMRVARKIGERGALWLLDVFRNPEDAYADKAMVRGGEYRPV